MLLKSGSFAVVEQQLERYKKEEEQEQLQGGWHTEVSLAALHWTECPNFFTHAYQPSSPRSVLIMLLDIPKDNDREFPQVGASSRTLPYQ